MAETVEEALSKGTLYSDGRTYIFVRIPTGEASQAAAISIAASSKQPFLGLLIDKDEITMMITKDDYRAAKESLEKTTHETGSFEYRLITFDVVMAPTLIGFMAFVAKHLADAKISVMPFAAYSRDHIFVSVGDFEKAMRILEAL
jgi:hypothetical protein